MPRQIGYEVLGKFYREHGQKNPRDARAQALAFFRPYVNMLRTIEGFTARRPLGTIEDHHAKVCTAAGKIFGITVYIRTNTQYFGVLMPFFEEPECQAIYYEFMKNDNQVLQVHDCTFENMRLIVAEESSQILWPKNNAEFNLE